MDASEVLKGILAHHGVKGMRWGVRRKATVGPQEVIVSDRRKSVKTSGGRGFPAHSDAVRAHTIGQIGKKSGVKSLSDEELQVYTKRLNLEANAQRLSYQHKSLAQKFIANLLGQTGKNATTAIANESTDQVRKHLTKLATA